MTERSWPETTERRKKKFKKNHFGVAFRAKSLKIIKTTAMFFKFPFPRHFSAFTLPLFKTKRAIARTLKLNELWNRSTKSNYVEMSGMSG